MGGSSKNQPLQTQTAEAAPSGIPSGPVQMQTFPAFSPGQQGLLAQQMQEGFGGSPQDYINAMSFYRDTQVPVINRPADIEAYIAQLKASGQLAAPPSVAAPAQQGAVHINAPTGMGEDGEAWVDTSYKSFMGSNR
jgi:hypothetical protein